MPKTTKKTKQKQKQVVKRKTHTCTICLEDCKKPSKLLNNQNKIICSHKFCFDCIKKWTKNTCPNCRKPYNKIKYGPHIKTVKLPSFAESTLEDTDIPSFLLECIDMLISSSESRNNFREAFFHQNEFAKRLWEIIDPIIILMEIKHSQVCDIPLHQHFPEFCFFINMIRRFSVIN